MALYKIPKLILSKIRILKKSKFLSVAVINLPKSEIEADRFKKFGLTYKGGRLIFAEKFVPRSSMGKYSRINKIGTIVKRKDLPKINKTFSIEVPNYGDWSKGSHDIERDRLVYQQEKIDPKNIAISPELIVDKNEEIVVGFKIDEVLDKSDKHLRDKLLFHLNLLQENFGTYDVISVGEPIREKKIYKKLDWEILPPGWWSDREKIMEIKEKLGSREGELLIERLKYIESLNPLERYEGRTLLGNRSYYVFIFKKNVLAECPMFGNAIYILDETNKNFWQEIFAKTKKEALKDAARILHKGNWKEKLKSFLS